MAIGDYYRMALESTFQGQTYVNIFHFRMVAQSAGAIPPNALGLQNEWQSLIGVGNSMQTRYQLLIPNQVQIARMVIRNLANPSDNVEAVVNIPGSRGVGDITPPQCCALISWRTATTGRRHRGRSFIGPVREADNTDGQLVTSYITALQSFIDGMATRFATSQILYQHVVYTRVLDTGLSVTSAIIRTGIKTQRRRARL